MAMYPASRLGSERHTLSVLVENRPGVLARIAGLFARRAFNINSLSVSPTERPDISRVTVTADVEAVPLEQIIKQLNKLLHVLKIVELDPNSTVERELVRSRDPRPARPERKGRRFRGYRALIRRLREDPVQAQKADAHDAYPPFFMRAYLITRTASKTTAPHASIMTATRRCIMATLTIRKIPDEQIQQLKEVAEKNNRSMESQVRSILEEWLAGTVAHEITRKTNFYDEIREFMKNMDFEGLDKGELPLSERNSADSRPPVAFE